MFLNNIGTNALEEAFPEDERRSEPAKQTLFTEESIGPSKPFLSSIAGLIASDFPAFPLLPFRTENSRSHSISLHWQVWFAAIFLVSFPVFLEAPLVRFAPWLSLVLTVGWLSIARQWREYPKTRLWGSLLWGFSLTWLCGAIYWGWLRSEPVLHLPIEAIVLPWAIWAIGQNPTSEYRVGSWFYLGSLLGTCVTDFYFSLVDLFPHWRAIMQVESDPKLVQPIFQSALALVQTNWGMAWAFGLGAILVSIACLAMRSNQICYWAFGGAVFGTIFVDVLFAILANFA